MWPTADATDQHFPGDGSNKTKRVVNYKFGRFRWTGPTHKMKQNEQNEKSLKEEDIVAALLVYTLYLIYLWLTYEILHVPIMSESQKHRGLHRISNVPMVSPLCPTYERRMPYVPMVYLWCPTYVPLVYIGCLNYLWFTYDVPPMYNWFP